MAKEDEFRTMSNAEEDCNDRVDIGNCPSDESSFYGDEQTRAELERSADAYNPRYYWDVVHWNIQCLAVQNKHSLPQGKAHIRSVQSTLSIAATSNNPAKTHASPVERIEEAPSSVAKIPYNPWEGLHSAKQLSESVDAFLSRLQPSTANIADVGPWIWVADPHSPRRPTNEDIAGFKQEGSKALSQYVSDKMRLEEQFPDKVKGSITQMLKPARGTLETSLFALAKTYGVTCGKWMLFPAPSEVDKVWSIIAKAVVSGELGCSAKVATNDGAPNDHQRLVCIYTDDFSDTRDVKRVLERMRQLGLVQASQDRSKIIYYKCDAYTYLDIMNGNEYKLKASMYNSKDMLSMMSI